MKYTVRRCPKSWRARFLGSADAPVHVHEKHRREWLKTEAMDAALARGWTLNNHDGAEAAAIFDFGLAALDPGYCEKSNAARARWLNVTGNKKLLENFGAEQ